jgi:hypothetical protein
VAEEEEGGEGGMGGEEEDGDEIWWGVCWLGTCSGCVCGCCRSLLLIDRSLLLSDRSLFRRPGT